MEGEIIMGSDEQELQILLQQVLREKQEEQAKSDRIAEELRLAKQQQLKIQIRKAREDIATLKRKCAVDEAELRKVRQYINENGNIFH